MCSKSHPCPASDPQGLCSSHPAADMRSLVSSGGCTRWSHMSGCLWWDLFIRAFFSSHPTLPPNEMQLRQLFLNFIQNCLFFLFFFLWKIRMDWCWQVKPLETFCKVWGAIGQAFVLPSSASPKGCFQLSQQQSGHFCFSVLIGVERRELLESSG